MSETTRTRHSATAFTRPSADDGTTEAPEHLGTLVEAVRSRGNVPAVLAVQADDVEPWTGDELAAQAGRLAAGFAAAGVGRGDRVALLADGSPQWVAVCLAALSQGVGVVPLDTQLGDDALTRILDDSQPKRVFADRRRGRRLERLERPEASDVLLLDADDDERSWRKPAPDGDERRRGPTVEPEDEAVLFYTSGTTGPPKGVPLTHANIVFQLRAMRDAALTREDDRVLLPLPLHHVYPLVIGLLTPLFLGLPVVFPRSLTGPELVRAIRLGEASVIVGVPRLYDQMLSAIESRVREAGSVARAAFAAASTVSRLLQRTLGLRLGRLLFRRLHRRFGGRLRLLASGGAALDPETATAFEALGWQIATGYGLTETSPLLTLDRPGKSRPGTAGRPIPGVEIRIEPVEEAAAGRSEGEVVVRGPGVFHGYRNLPEKTEDAFTEDGWFRTGDLGWLDDDGFLHVTGRVSTRIVTESGENVQPDEVEEAYATPEVVRECGVLEDEGRLAAVLVPTTEAVHWLSPEGLHRQLDEAVDEAGRSLPTHQQISRYVVSDRALPRTRLGKIRRHELEELYRELVEAEERPDAERSEQRPPAIDELPAADQSLLEEPAARAVWELFTERFPNRRVTPDGHLRLELGIDSMDWLNLTLDIRRRAGIELTEDAIERVETLRDLLELVAESESIERAEHADPLESPEEILTERQRHWLEPLSPTQRVLARAFDIANRLAFRTYFRLRVRGRDRLPESGPCLLVPNHTSFLDPPALGAALGYERLRATSWAGFAETVFESPLLRGVARLGRTFPVDPEAGTLSSLAFGAAVLRSGRNLVWFPEGERSPTGELLDFRPGVGLLLNHFRIPAVPVCIEGPYEAMPMGRRFPRPRRITVTFGDPVQPHELPGGTDDDEAARAIADLLHDRVAELCDRCESSSPGS